MRTLKDVTGKSPNRSVEEGHIIRRLGAAVVYQWYIFSDEVRDRVMTQASAVADEVEAVQPVQDIEAFIEKHAQGGQKQWLLDEDMFRNEIDQIRSQMRQNDVDLPLSAMKHALINQRVSKS